MKATSSDEPVESGGLEPADDGDAASTDEPVESGGLEEPPSDGD